MPRAKTKEKPLWRCPKCGWQFVTRNLWHSCVRVPLDRHFQGKDPVVRQLFDKLVAALRKNGPVTIVGSKTRIALMTRIRFLALTPQKRALSGGFALTHRVRHPLLRPGLRYGPLYGYSFRLTDPKQIDAGFRRLLAEAYRVGRQEHLKNRGQADSSPPRHARARNDRRRWGKRSRQKHLAPPRRKR